MSSIKYLIVIFTCAITLSSCDKESIKIQARIVNCNYEECEITVEPLEGTAQKSLGKCIIDVGEFDLKIKEVKPPVKLSFHFKDTICRIWIGEFGKNVVEGDFAKEISLNVTNTFFNNELNRFKKANDEAYLSKVRSAEKEVKDLYLKEDEGTLEKGQKTRMYQLEDKIKRAYKLRKKALLSAVRKDPKNAIAMTVFFDMFPSLTSWQKEECMKNASKYFSDSGLNWQLKH